ncbi:MAG: FtsX-like permease family protein, partial [bacterium]|nr:FtsX-like permease family protein [bacterium]
LSATDFPASPRSGQNSVWYVDAAALVAAQRDAVDQPRVPAALAEVGERIPAVASPGLGVEVGDTSMTLNGRGVEVVAVLESVAGVRQTVEGLVVDAAALPEGPIWVPRAALIDVAPGADAAAVAEEVRAVAGSGVATVREGYGLGFDGSPLGDAMRATQIGAVGIAAAFVGLVLVLTQMLDAPRRARVVAVMRTVGLRRGQAAQLAAWELAPTVVVSVVAGALVGLLVPWMVAATTDLTPLTGGEREPVLALDPGVVGGVLGVIVLVAVAAVAISAWVAGRASIGTELREVGE